MKEDEWERSQEANSCHHRANAAFQDRTGRSTQRRFQAAPKAQGTPFAGTSIPGKVDGRTSISWTGGSNKSFMKRIGNIIARAKRMLICFAT